MQLDKSNIRSIDGKYMSDVVSIIVPVYNRDSLVTDTLYSIYEQTYRPIEVIIVDDGSTDDSRKVIANWAEKHESYDFSIKTYGQKNSGPSAARNHGLKKSNGEYIQFLDSDDILHKNKLSTQVEVIKKNASDFCVCNYQNFTDSILNSGQIVDFYSRSHSIIDFPIQYPMDTPAPLYTRKTIVNSGLWDETIESSEDFEYNFRVLARGAKGVWIKSVLLYVRKHDGKERIQANPLKSRYKSMYIGLVKMEIEAIEQGRCTKKLLENFGHRALLYSEHMKAEGSEYESKIFQRHATSRISLHKRALFYLRRRIYNPFCEHFCPGGISAFKKNWKNFK